MRKNDLVLLVCGVAAAAAASITFFFDRRLAFGLLAGYATGQLNYVLLAVQVKRLLAAPGAPAVKSAAAVLLYVFRLLLAAAVIAAVIKASGYFSIAGFLGGFTLFVLAVLTAGALSAKK